MDFHSPLSTESQIAEALQAAHVRGIVHRDLKPSNIKITGDGRIKVLDFGLAKVVASEDGASAAETTTGTRRGEVVGTPAYMSPEQARGEPVDKQADVWAFGCVLYEMLTCRSPFVAETTSATLARVLDHEPDWDKLPSETPPSAARVVRRCLAKNQDQRLHDIADARLDLDDALSKRIVPIRARHTRRYAIAAAATVTVLGAIAWIGVSLKPPPARPPVINVKISIPPGSATADPGRLLGPPVVSPDGSAIVVSLNTGKQSGLFVRRLDANTLTLLEGSAGGAYPFWSPDSKTIGFFADGKLKTVAAAGGTVVTSCEAPAQRGGAWSSQGTIIFGINLRGIFRCDRDSGQAVEITTLDKSLGENSHRYPVFLPDGNRFLYYARTNDLDKRSVYLESLDRQLPRTRVLVADGQFALGRDSMSGQYYLLSQQSGRIFAQVFDVRSALLTGEPIPILDRGGQVSVSDTDMLVVRPEAQDRSRLVWFDRAGREISTLDAPTDYWQVALSPDGGRVAVTKHDYLSGAFDIWAAAADGQFEPISRTRSLSPAWSADGKTLYYTMAGGRRLLRRPLEPQGAEEVLEEQSDGTLHIRASSHINQLLIAERWLSGGNKRGIYWKSPDAAWVSFSTEGTLNEHPSLSPDEKWLAYESDRTGSDEIYVGAFPTGPTYRISQAGGREPHWRADGRELFFLALDGSVYAVDVTNGFRGLAPVRLFRAAFRRGSEGPLFAVTADGQRFLTIVGESVETPDSIDLVLNWPSLRR